MFQVLLMFSDVELGHIELGIKMICCCSAECLRPTDAAVAGLCRDAFDEQRRMQQNGAQHSFILVLLVLLQRPPHLQKQRDRKVSVLMVSS